MPHKRGAGEGSISKRPNGTWYARYTVRLPDGTTKRPAIYGKTRREVAEKLAKVLNEINLGIFVEPSKITIEQYLTYWLEQSVRPNIRPATFVSYEVIVRLHLIAGLGDILLQGLTPQHVEAYKNRKLAEPMAPRSVAYHLTLLRAALDQAVKWNYVQRNVAGLVDKPRVPRYQSARMTVEQAQTLLQALRGDRMEALYILAVATGMRRGELLGLRWCDVDLDRSVLYIRTTLIRLKGELRFQEPKTEKGKRVVYLPRFAMRALQDHRDRQWVERQHAGPRWQDTDLVFPTTVGTPYEPRNLNRHFDRLTERAGLPHIRLHDIRHSAASIMEAAGVSLKTLSTILGHSTIGITGDLYVTPYDASQEDAARKMDDIFGSPKD